MKSVAPVYSWTSDGCRVFNDTVFNIKGSCLVLSFKLVGGGLQVSPTTYPFLCSQTLRSSLSKMLTSMEKFDRLVGRLELRPANQISPLKLVFAGNLEKFGYQ